MAYLITFYFIVLDFFTGLLKAFATTSFSSKVMRQGLFHKLSLICVMALGWLVEYAQRFVDLGIDFIVPAGGAACGYIILMEICSSLENLCQSNPELMPRQLYQIFGLKREDPSGPAGHLPLSGEAGEEETSASVGARHDSPTETTTNLVPPDKGGSANGAGGFHENQ